MNSASNSAHVVESSNLPAHNLKRADLDAMAATFTN
jgi:hypothetical protein